jgi:hypothetical protein
LVYQVFLFDMAHAHTSLARYSLVEGVGEYLAPSLLNWQFTDVRVIDDVNEQATWQLTDRPAGV